MPRPQPARDRGPPCHHTARRYRQHEERQVERQEFWRDFGQTIEREDARLLQEIARQEVQPQVHRVSGGTLFVDGQEHEIRDVRIMGIDYGEAEARIMAFMEEQSTPVPLITFEISL